MSKDLTTANGQLRDLGSSQHQRAIAINAMSVVHRLRMTGTLVTRCADLGRSAVFLSDVFSGEATLTEANVLSLAEVLGVSVDFLSAPMLPSSRERSARTGQHLRLLGRLSAEGEPTHDEDAILAGRFPEVVRALEEEVRAQKEERMAGQMVELLFLGDIHKGTMWVEMLRKYRAVHAWFREEYQITKIHEEKIAEGRLGVPVPVHQMLMLKVEERIASADNIKVPRMFIYLQKLEVLEKHAYDLRDTTETPLSAWLTARGKD